MKKSTPKRTFGQQDVEVETYNTVYKGFFRVHLARLRHKLFRGGWSEWIEREVIDRGHAVVVLPYDPVRDSIVMLEQFRVGSVHLLGAPERHPSQPEASPWLLELVAGMSDTGEDEETVARREMQEEAGLEAKRLEYVMSYLSTPGGLTERISIFIAQVDATTASQFGGLASEHEDIRVFELPRNDVMALLDQGQIDNAATVIALQWLALHRDTLLEKWEL